LNGTLSSMEAPIMQIHDPAITNLFVLHDPRCSFCQHCKRWMEHERKLIAIEFIAAGSPAARGMFPGLYVDAESIGEELIVIDNLGGVYRDTSAFVMCLWGLVGYRSWSYRLAGPTLLPLARRAFGFLPSHRYALSRILYRDMNHEDLARQIAMTPEPGCHPTPATDLDSGLTTPTACPATSAWHARISCGDQDARCTPSPSGRV